MLGDEEQIRALIAQWQSATQAGDVDTVLSLVAEDAVFLSPGRPPMHKAEFAELSRPSLGSSSARIDSTADIQEIQVVGDMAFAWTRLAVRITPPGGHEAVHRAGHALTVFRRTGGRWLLWRDANLLAQVDAKNAAP